MHFFSRNPNSNSATPNQHLIHPQNKDKRFRIPLPHLFRRSRRQDAAPQILDVDITTPEIQVPKGHEQQEAEVRGPNANNPYPVGAPSATQIQGNVNISGNPRFTNIGMTTGNVTTVINYGGIYGLENLKDSVSFAALHDSAEQDPTRRCHPGTRKNVLRQMRDWIDDTSATNGICWLYGPAGAGKSAIAQTIAHAYEDGEVAATFFFYRSDPSSNNGNRLFPTIAWQLAFAIPAMKDFIVHALDRTPHLPKKDVETQFKQLVAYPFQPTNNVISQMSQLAPVVIIDGLDECSDEHLQRRILSVIGNAVKDCLVPLRFLICSRPEALIEEALDEFKNITLRINLGTLDDSNRDIEKYLVDQFSDIRSKRSLSPTWPSPHTIDEFVFKSSGNFIFASTVMRHIGDEDCDPEEQLDIVRNLKPRGKMSPFALLDELYIDILKRQRDQEFLKTFLALFVGRSTIDQGHEDDAILMKVSEKILHTKLRRMRSLFKFEPFIDVHHKSFLDFLQDLSRSGQYHVSKQDGQKRYLELSIDYVIQHVSMAFEQPDAHECYSSLAFERGVQEYPPSIELPDEDWQSALKPLLRVQDRLLVTLMPRSCGLYRIMRDLLLHWAIFLGNSYHLAASLSLQTQESNMNKAITKQGPGCVTETDQRNDLDKCFSMLLSYLQKIDPMLAVDAVVIDLMSSVLVFDLSEIMARVQSAADAQTLIDLIVLLNNNESFLSQCGRDAAHKTALIASEIYARIPLLPRSVFSNRPIQQCQWLLGWDIDYLESTCQSLFINKILNHDYVLPMWCIYQKDKAKFVYGNVNERNESVVDWAERADPNFVTRIRVMLEVAKIVRYLHSMDVVASYFSNLVDAIGIYRILDEDTVSLYQKGSTLDSNLHAKIAFYGVFAWQVGEKLLKQDYSLWPSFTSKSNMSEFGNLFQKVCFDGINEPLPNQHVEDVKQLIERCQAMDPQDRPTMEDVVEEMETWNLN